MKDGVPWRMRAKLAAKSRGTTLRKPRPDTPPGHNPHKKRGIIPWKPEPLFKGKTVCIVGGGPSLKNDMTQISMSLVRELHPDVKWVVVNNAYKLCPWADLLFFADCGWWEWNGSDVLAKFRGLVATATSDVCTVNDARIKRLWRDRNNWSEDPNKVYGWDGGTMAINLAYHMGAAKIVLWGFDMRPGPKGETQWHNDHRRRTDPANYELNFIPRLTKSVKVLDSHGISVVRCTEPGLDCIPCVSVADAVGA